MMPVNYKMNDHYKGDTFEGVRFTIKDSSTELPIDLVGASIFIDFRSGNEKGASVLKISLGSGITLEDAINGVFTIDSFVLDWRARIYHYDIQIVFLDGTVKTYVKGTINITQDTTNG